MDPTTSTKGDGGGRPVVKRFQHNELDYEVADGNVNHENHKNTGESANDDDGGGGISSWFGDLQTRPSSSTVKAGQKMISDLYESAVIGTSHANTFKVLKILVLLFVKFKVFALMKFWFIVKMLVLAKIVKFILLPFVVSTFTGFASSQTLVPAPSPACPGLLIGPPGPPGPPSENTVSAYNMTSASEQSSAAASSSSLYRNGSASMPAAVAHNRFMEFDTFGAAFVPKLARFVSTVQSAQCVQRMACTEAGSKSPKSEFVWING